MPRQIWSEGQEIASGDLNKIAKSLALELYERVIFQLADRQTDFAFGDSFQVEYLSALQVTVRAGLGFQTDNTQVSPESTKRLIYNAAQVTKSLAAADLTNPRIDIVCIKANRANSVTETKNVKAIDGTISATSVATQEDWAADIVVTTGTPAGSPAVPATPAGYLKLAEIAVAAATGLAGASGVTDKRTRYKRPNSQKTVRAVTATATIDKDDELIFCTTTSGNQVHVLPAASEVPGKEYTFFKVTSDANTVGFSQNISGEAQTIGYQYGAMTIISNGTSFYSKA